MAIAIMPKKGLGKPPSKAAAIDWSHPLANGLVACFLMNENGGISVQDLVTGARVGTWTITNFNWGMAVGGTSPAFTGTNNDKVSFPTMPYLQQPLPMTMVTCVRPTTLGTNRGVMGNDEHAAAYSGISMFVFPLTGIQLNFGDNTGGTTADRRSGLGTLFGAALNTDTHLVGVVRGAADMDLYNNGRRETMSYDGTGGALAYNSSPASVGRGLQVSASAWVGYIYHAYWYNRALTPTEAQWLYTDQYAFLKPAKPRAFSIGGITPVSTARSYGAVFG